jgi:hypothetical protein
VKVREMKECDDIFQVVEREVELDRIFAYLPQARQIELIRHLKKLHSLFGRFDGCHDGISMPGPSHFRQSDLVLALSVSRNSRRSSKVEGSVSDSLISPFCASTMPTCELTQHLAWTAHER